MPKFTPEQLDETPGLVADHALLRAEKCIDANKMDQAVAEALVAIGASLQWIAVSLQDIYNHGVGA